MVSAQNLVTVAAFGAVGIVLQGCGGGDETTTTTTTSKSAGPSEQPFALDEDKKITLEWSNDADLYTFTLTGDFGTATQGWLAMGFSDDGKMGNGNYIMGYGEDCVRSFVNDKVGSIPMATGGLTLTNTSLTKEGSKMTIVATADVSKLGLSKGQHNVLFAAASADHMPTACDTELAAGMQHDLHTLVGSNTVTFGAGSDSFEI